MAFFFFSGLTFKRSLCQISTMLKLLVALLHSSNVTLANFERSFQNYYTPHDVHRVTAAFTYNSVNSQQIGSLDYIQLYRLKLVF